MIQASNNFTITGNITKNPEIKTTQNGKKYAFVTVAVNGMGKDEVSFISFIAWEKLAENITKYCNKGDMISVIGSIGTRQDQDKHNIIQLTADAVTFLHKSAKKTEEKKMEPEKDSFVPVTADPFLPF